MDLDSVRWVKARSYSHEDAPEVEVLWEGRWCFGTLHQWRKTDDGRWQGFVRFNVAPGENRLGHFDEGEIRPAPPATPR